MTKWTDFASSYAKKHNMSYKEAISSKKVQDMYDKSKGTSPGKKGAVKRTGKGKDKEIDDSTKKGGVRKTARKAYMK